MIGMETPVMLDPNKEGKRFGQGGKIQTGNMYPWTQNYEKTKIKKLMVDNFIRHTSRDKSSYSVWEKSSASPNISCQINYNLSFVLLQ